jgi:hypothetical protein
MPDLMSGDWKRSRVAGPQRLQGNAWTAPDLYGHRASPRLFTHCRLYFESFTLDPSLHRTAAPMGNTISDEPQPPARGGLLIDFVEDRLEMVLQRVDRDAQALGQVLDPQTGEDQGHDLAFARCQRVHADQKREAWTTFRMTIAGHRTGRSTLSNVPSARPTVRHSFSVGITSAPAAVRSRACGALARD